MGVSVSIAGYELPGLTTLPGDDRSGGFQPGMFSLVCEAFDAAQFEKLIAIVEAVWIKSFDRRPVAVAVEHPDLRKMGVTTALLTGVRAEKIGRIRFNFIDATRNGPTD